MSLKDVMLRIKAFYRHEGRPGQRGGSKPRLGGSSKIEVSPGKFSDKPTMEKKLKLPKKGEVKLVEKRDGIQGVKVGDVEIGQLRRFQGNDKKMRWSFWVNEEFDTTGGPPKQFNSVEEAQNFLSKAYNKK